MELGQLGQGPGALKVGPGEGKPGNVGVVESDKA